MYRHTELQPHRRSEYTSHTDSYQSAVGQNYPTKGLAAFDQDDGENEEAPPTPPTPERPNIYYEAPPPLH